MYGVIEDGYNAVDANKILSSIRCELHVVSSPRLSRYSTSASDSSKPQPLKVELPTVADCVHVLNAANTQRYKLHSFKVKISPLLQSEKLSKLNKLRQRCFELNGTASDVDGKKPYIVISDRLMICQPGGGLEVYSDRPDIGKLSTSTPDSVEKTLIPELSSKN